MRLFVLLLVLLPLTDVAFAEKHFAGAMIFRQKKCDRCHTTQPGALVPTAPSLKNLHSKSSLLEIAAAFWNHVPQMSEQMKSKGITLPALNESEAADLTAYLVLYTYYEAQVKISGDAVRGEIVWKGKKCAACHSLAAAKNGKIGTLLSFAKVNDPVTLAKSMWNHGPKMAASILEHGVPVPRFQSGEAIDLLAYIRAKTSNTREIALSVGDPIAGWAVFGQKRCSTCHSETGSLSSQKQTTRPAQIADMGGQLWNHFLVMREKMKSPGSAFAQFSDREMNDLIAYLYLRSYLQPTGNAERGKELFSQKGCGSCHANAQDVSFKAGGELDTEMKAIVIMWNHASMMYSRTKAQGESFPRFKTGEMKDLVAFLRKR